MRGVVLLLFASLRRAVPSERGRRDNRFAYRPYSTLGSHSPICGNTYSRKIAIT